MRPVSSNQPRLRLAMSFVAVAAVALLTTVDAAQAKFVYACVQKNGSTTHRAKAAMRLVRPAARCLPAERRLSWISTMPGPQGKAGAGGAPGPQGPAGPAGPQGPAGSDRRRRLARPARRPARPPERTREPAIGPPGRKVRSANPAPLGHGPSRPDWPSRSNRAAWADRSDRAARGYGSNWAPGPDRGNGRSGRGRCHRASGSGRGRRLSRAAGTRRARWAAGRERRDGLPGRSWPGRPRRT